MESMRTYGDPCGIARALDVVGERWALLIVRELLLGPKRFGDLRADLAGLSANVLTQRLGELQVSGVVERRQLDPPATSWVYELTEWGRGLEPALLALGRWGSRSPARHDNELSPDAMIIALLTTYQPGPSRQSPLSIEIRIGRRSVCLVAEFDGLETRSCTATECDSTIATNVTTLRSLAFGGLSVDEAASAGSVHLDGDAASAQDFFNRFTRPIPVDQS